MAGRQVCFYDCWKQNAFQTETVERCAEQDCQTIGDTNFFGLSKLMLDFPSRIRMSRGKVLQYEVPWSTFAAQTQRRKLKNASNRCYLDISCILHPPYTLLYQVFVGVNNISASWTCLARAHRALPERLLCERLPRHL